MRGEFTNATFAPEEIALRLHTRLTGIHRFSSGNGRRALLAADLLVVSFGGKRFTWRSGKFVEPEVSAIWWRWAYAWSEAAGRWTSASASANRRNLARLTTRWPFFWIGPASNQAAFPSPSNTTSASAGEMI
jgi:hypothetical protein